MKKLTLTVIADLIRHLILLSRRLRVKPAMTLLLLLLFVMARNEAISQNRKIDSLQALLKTDKEDTNKVKHLNNVCNEYIKIGSYDTAIVLANQALALCDSSFEGGKGDVLTLFYTCAKANAYNTLGNVNLQQGNYPKALDYYLKALKINETLKDKKRIAAILGNIGLVYDNQADYPKALDYYFKALKIAEELKDKNGVARHLGNIGIVYYNQVDYPKALDYYFKALKMKEELGNKNGIAILLGNIGNIYKEQADYPKALDYDFKALKMDEELRDKNSIAIVLSNIGSLYTDTKKYKEAETYLLDALKIDKEIGAQDGERDDEEKLSELYEQTGRNKEALAHYKSSMLLKDTIFSQENHKSMIRKEMNFEFEKKESVTKAQHDAETKQQKIITWSVGAGFLLVLVFAGYVYRSLRIAKKQKELVDRTYKELREKHEEIQASIRYAKRIQDALMTSPKYIARELNRMLDGSKTK
ncbi:MAG: tetratricopeptide repeat protein [Bacteroidia bacterium]